MGKVIKEFLVGAGSVLQLCPPTNLTPVRPDFMRVSDAERMASDWQRVGSHLQRAIDKVSPEVSGHGARK